MKNYWVVVVSNFIFATSKHVNFMDIYALETDQFNVPGQLVVLTKIRQDNEK
jgi:hypothetical protein